MLSFNPDTSIRDFLRKNIPVVFVKIDSSVKWTMYPDTIKEPEHYEVIHSYVFNQHPFFNGHFKCGQLAFTQKVYSEKKWNENIIAIELWFEFDNERDARNSFKQLIDTCSSFHTLKRFSSQKGIDKAEFTDKNSDKYGSNCEIILAIDYTLGKRFLMPADKGNKIITAPGYKIIIETSNDLN
ncbi:MAG: hypothetical protein ACJ75B_04550 [Flavisolibacter sp.]